MMGVGPSGAQVRRRVGRRRTPLASRTARRAPSRRAFFYRGPSVTLPVRNGLFVAWARLAGGQLTAPAQAAQALPSVCRVIAPPKGSLDHRRDPPYGPQLVGQPMGCGPLAQARDQVGTLLRGQPARAARGGLGGQGRVAPLLPGLAPLRHGCNGCRGPTCHLASAQPLGQERDAIGWPSQCVESSFRYSQHSWKVVSIDHRIILHKLFWAPIDIRGEQLCVARSPSSVIDVHPAYAD
jgi:hypothetical protein